MNIILPCFKLRMVYGAVMGWISLFGITLHAEMELETMAVFTGDNGTEPGALIQTPDGTFYGTTTSGGKNGLGTVFSMAPNKPLKTLVTFDGQNGSQPSPRLIEGSDRCLYGTTKGGGTHDLGTVYRIASDGSLQTLLSFDGASGSEPQPDLVVEADGSVYGCTGKGGANDKGTLFKIGLDHQIQTLVSFSNSTGAYPQGLSRGLDGKLYGATSEGGAGNYGTVFALDPKGGFTTISSFTTSDAANQHSHLAVSSGGDFYGTSLNGGENNLGTIYSISRSGAVNQLGSFSEETGGHPGADLVEWNNGFFYMQQLYNNMQIKSSAVQWMGVNLCGTTMSGGEHGSGTIFRLTAGGKIATIASFTGVQGDHPGSAPNSLVVGADGNLYGTTGWGGTANKGTVFRLLVSSWKTEGDSMKRMRLLSVGLPNLISAPVVSF